jgi:hypothetical protein
MAGYFVCRFHLERHICALDRDGVTPDWAGAEGGVFEQGTGYRLRRTLRHFGRTRHDMAAGCQERFDWPFLKYIWNYRRAHRPRVLEALRGFTGTVVILEDPPAVAAYLTRTGQATALPQPAA